MYGQVLMGLKLGDTARDVTVQGMYEGVWTAGGCCRRGIVWLFTFVFVVVLKECGRGCRPEDYVMLLRKETSKGWLRF